MQETYSFQDLVQELPHAIASIVGALARTAGVPPAMGLALATNALATALQRRFVLELPDGELEPIHRIDIVLGEPEDGKNSLMRLTHGPIKAFDKKVEAIRARAGLPVLGRPLLLESDMPADLIEVVEGEAMATTVALVDGGLLLASPYFRGEKQKTCCLWDGHGHYSHRDGKSRLRGARNPVVSFLGMPQAGPWRAYLDKYGPSAIGGGLLQRCSFTFLTPCAPDDHDADLDQAWISAFQQALTQLLGSAEDYAMGERTELIPVQLSDMAARAYMELRDIQKRARLAGAPAPWRALQKALRTSLPFEIMMTCKLPATVAANALVGSDGARHGSPQAHLPPTDHVALPDAYSVELRGARVPQSGGLACADMAGDVPPSTHADIEAMLNALGARLLEKRTPASASIIATPDNVRVSQCALDAALRYNEWQHAQPPFRAMQQLAQSKSAVFAATLPRRLTKAESRYAKLHEDADEIMRQVEEHLGRNRIRNLPALAEPTDLGEAVDYVLERDIANRVGLYPLLFKKALAHLLDEGYLLQRGSGRLTRLSRTGRFYHHWRGALLQDSPL